MSDERAQLLERIGSLAGQINRHKNQQAGAFRPSTSHTSGPAGYHPYHRAPYYPRGGFRGGYRGRGSGYRGRGLAVNASAGRQVWTPNSGQTHSGTPSPATPYSAIHTSPNTPLTDSTHNSTPLVSRQQAVQRKNAHERARLRSYFRNEAAGHVEITDHAGKQYVITILGAKYIVANGGSKLIRLDQNDGDPAPKTVDISGVKFFRSKHGNLYRHGFVQDQRTAARKSEPCRAFSTTGSCPKGTHCYFVHDFDRVSVCRDFLQNGSCASGENCDLSHDLKPQRLPACLHYAKGNCTNEECRYGHCTAPLSAPVCRNFGLYGWCDKGLVCANRHVNECPDFSNTGECKMSGCKLLHRERASVMRRKKERQENSEFTDDEESSSLDSDEFESDIEELYHDDDAEEFDSDVDVITM